MTEGNVLLVIGLVGLLVVGVNGLLILAMRRGGGSTGIDLFRKAVKRARNPWEDENQQLKELSERVKELTGNEEERGS